MFCLRATLDRALDAARIEQGELKKRVKQWRRAALQESANTRAMKAERDAAVLRAESAETKYAALVERLLTPPKLVAPSPHAPIDPEVVSLDRLSDDTVKRMAEQFARDGMSPDTAEAHAKELVSAAERMWGGAE